MNEETPTPEQTLLSPKELQHLLREGGPPLTRREIRMRDRAEEAGLLTRVGDRLVIADPAPAPPVAAERSEEPPIVTSADVLAGKVPAASGLTRRQLRELAAQEAEQVDPSVVDTGELEETVESAPLFEEPAEEKQPAPTTPQRISTRIVASELNEQHIPKAPQGPGEQSARRPVVHPEGAHTGEYTGEYDQIRKAMADINAAPDSLAGNTSAGGATTEAGEVPARRSIFEASIPEELDADPARGASPAEETNAADWTAVIGTPVVTDDLLPDLEPVEPAVPERAAPEVESGVMHPRDEQHNFPDWHTLTSIPAVTESPQGEPQPIAHAATEPQRQGAPLWLTLLQWLVIAVVAVVLGLLVWYAINRGFGSEAENAAGIVSPLYHLRI